MQKKLNFRSVLSLVIGSQIGSGVFLLPASLAMIGPISLFGYLISGSGAILLALVFAKLSMLVTNKGGGPHVYVEKAFGRKAAFFTAWTYWLVSWVSSLAVIIAGVSYLAPMIGVKNHITILFLQIWVVSIITYINIRGTSVAGSVEFVLTVTKCIPLTLIPLAALCFMQPEYFHPINPHHLEITNSLNAATVMTFWGFVGLEMATGAAAVIENPTKTIPRAVVLGTFLVALIYILNSVAVMGVVPNDILSKSEAPYMLATQMIFGSGWNMAVSAVAFTACMGALNAWVLTSGQIAVEAAKDGLFPPIFAKTNRFGAPFVSLLIVLICTISLLVLTLTPNLLQQINAIIDISVTTFLFVYLTCAIALLKMFFTNVVTKSKPYLVIALLAITFCIWVLWNKSIENLSLCSLFVISGIPIYFWQRKKIEDLLEKKSLFR